MPTEPMNRSKPRICVALDRTWCYAVGWATFTYLRLVRHAGGYPLRSSYPASDDNSRIRSTAKITIEASDGLMLCGGGDIGLAPCGEQPRTRNTNPRRDRYEMALIECARQRGLPILGICRGCQLLNIAYGGTVRPIDDATSRRLHRRIRPHGVALSPDSRLAELLGSTELAGVRSLHRHAIDKPGGGLRIVARATDGVAEAIECTPNADAPWSVGIQWHPELVVFGAPDRTLLEEFVRQAHQAVKHNRISASTRSSAG